MLIYHVCWWAPEWCCMECFHFPPIVLAGKLIRIREWGGGGGGGGGGPEGHRVFVYGVCNMARPGRGTAILFVGLPPPPHPPSPGPHPPHSFSPPPSLHSAPEWGLVCLQQSCNPIFKKDFVDFKNFKLFLYKSNISNNMFQNSRKIEQIFVGVCCKRTKATAWGSLGTGCESKRVGDPGAS